jgi:hypothetical protein
MLQTYIHKVSSLNLNWYTLLYVVIVDKVDWTFQVRADEIKPLFSPKV